MTDPVLYLGVDIGYRRDTSAVVAVFRKMVQVEGKQVPVYRQWGHRIFAPPVNIAKTVVKLLLYVIENNRVALISFDPSQFASEAQRLEDDGHGRLLKEVNQQTEMVEYANTLHSHISTQTWLPYLIGGKDLRSHFSWTAAQSTERGFRLVKLKQSRPIDGTVATAMALSGATEDLGYLAQPAYEEEHHNLSAVMIP